MLHRIRNMPSLKSYAQNPNVKGLFSRIYIKNCTLSQERFSTFRQLYSGAYVRILRIDLFGDFSGSSWQLSVFHRLPFPNHLE